MKNKSALPELDPLDKRLNAIRSDIVDENLRHKIKAKSYVSGKAGRVMVPVCNLVAEPDFNAQTQHQLLRGEEVMIFDKADGWAWVQSLRDGYVGYVPQQAISTANNAMLLTHVVHVPMTFCYPQAELRSPPLYSLSMGSRVIVTGSQTVRGTTYSLLAEGGAIIASHLRKVNHHDKDVVEICERLVNIAYLWGGASGFGLDCSGLIQLAMRMCGHEVLRDSDMQAATIGKVIDAGDNYHNLQRGDLIFWNGHVAVHKGTIHKVPHIIHASGHTMSVAIEPLHTALERIEYLYEKPIGYRRPALSWP